MHMPRILHNQRNTRLMTPIRNSTSSSLCPRPGRVLVSSSFQHSTPFFPFPSHNRLNSTLNASLFVYTKRQLHTSLANSLSWLEISLEYAQIVHCRPRCVVCRLRGGMTKGDNPIVPVSTFQLTRFQDADILYGHTGTKCKEGGVLTEDWN